MGGVVDAAAAHGIEHQHGWWMAALGDHRVVLRPAPDVRIEVIRAALQRDFPVGLSGGILVWLHPVALLQAHDLRAQIGQTLGDGRPGGARSDHQHIRLFVGQRITPASCGKK